ncbi:MAG: hypothetical protein IFK94_08570 [Acidobacteria bacterium]|uniref:Uncharacterized protein n=1 Tax=Candidatus Polarisedimenticola svalbardensis TaxID=2886004 RepID=A0A8J6XX39_9BACT|nr:hypothetical protein [Candidatus Polarisedimenticola svalbardensis]
MLKIAPQPGMEDLDGLRLLALSRITRCSGCPRYHALAEAYRGVGPVTGLPQVPLACDHQVCAPLVSRLVRSIA